MAQELSVIQQEKAVGDWARRNSIIVSRIFKDIARSGKQLAGRDAFIEMMDYLNGRTPEIGLVLWEFSRLSRDYDDAQYYLADLRRKGYTIFSINDDIPNNLEGRLLESIVSWKNARYIEDLRRNVIRGQRYVVEVHHAWFSHTPVGYVKVEKSIGSHRDGTAHIIHTLDIDPHTAPIVQRAFQLRAEGATYSEIHQATHLFPWLQTYSKLLRNEVYIGYFHNELWNIKNYCPAIIDMDTWNKVQSVNQDRREKSGYNHPRAVRSRYLLSGILHCASCGLTMNGMGIKIKRNHFYYYVCIGRSKTENKCTNRYIRQDQIEPRVINAIKSLLLDDRMLQDIYEEARRQSSSRNSESDIQMSRMKAELNDININISRVINAIKEAGHSSALLLSLADMEKRKSELETEIARLDVPVKVPEVDMTRLSAYILNLLNTAEPYKLAELLRSLIVNIKAYKDDKVSGEIECIIPGMTDRNIFIPL